jgi:putative acetyltransferase
MRTWRLLNPSNACAGHPTYYSRFGFSARPAERLKAPFSGPSFQALELAPETLADVTGEVRCPPPFGPESSHP